MKELRAASILEQLHDALGDDLAAIEKRFKPGVKVTLVVRRPDNDEADVVIGSDDLDEAIAAIRRRQVRPSTVTGGIICMDNSPEWFTGRWRDWHRGHACDKDDGKPRTAEGAAEIERGGRP